MYEILPIHIQERYSLNKFLVLPLVHQNNQFNQKFSSDSSNRRLVIRSSATSLQILIKNTLFKSDTTYKCITFEPFVRGEPYFQTQFSPTCFRLDFDAFEMRVISITTHFRFRNSSTEYQALPD